MWLQRTSEELVKTKETVDVYLKRANEDNSFIKKFTKESIEALTSSAKEAELASKEAYAHAAIPAPTTRLPGTLTERLLVAAGC